MEDAIIPGTDLKQGDIVWAKIGGYPWWPGRIVGYRHDQTRTPIAVNFIGDESHAYLAISKVVDYITNREKNSKTKRKDLTEAIKLADKMIERDDGSKMPLIETVEVPKKSSRKRQHQNSSTEESIILTKSSPGKKLKTLEDAGAWLEDLVTSDKLKADISSTQKLLTALDIVKEKIGEHECILETRVGINLNKLVGYYSKDLQFTYAVKKMEETLELLKDIVLTAYFGSTLNSNKEDNLNKNGTNIRNQQEIEALELFTPIKKEESILIQNEYSLENSEDDEEIQMSGPCSNSDLRTNVCHEIARFVEEVSLV